MKKIRTLLKVIGYGLLVIWVLGMAYDGFTNWGIIGFFAGFFLFIPFTIYTLFLFLITGQFGELVVSILYLAFTYLLIFQADE